MAQTKEEEKERVLKTEFIGFQWDINSERWETLYLNPETEIKGISPYNTRKTFPDKELEELVTSMQNCGINTRPIVLDQNNEVVEGGRRYKAALQAGLKRVLCSRKTMTPKEARIRSFVENELSLGHDQKDRYLFAKALTEEGMRPEEIGLVVGRSHQTVREWLAYQKYPRAIAEADAEAEANASKSKSKFVETVLDSEAFQSEDSIIKQEMRRIYDNMGSEKRDSIRSILDKKEFEDLRIIRKLTDLAKTLNKKELESLAEDVKRGEYDKDTLEKLKELKKKHDNREKYIEKTLRIPLPLYTEIIRVHKTTNSSGLLEETIITALQEWTENKIKQLGLIR